MSIAYVGSNTHQLSDDSEGIEGSNFAALADQNNKTPLGAFFKPDPITGVQSTNPENLGTNLARRDWNSNRKQSAGLSPVRLRRTAQMRKRQLRYDLKVPLTLNYNGLQVAWIKTTGNLGYNLNFTWSRTLGTGLQENPFDVSKNYGPTQNDRPFVFNASYYYNTGKLHTSQAFTNQVLGGWTISGISTWQAGGYIPAALGNGVPNFNFGISYTGVTAAQAAQGIGNGLGAASYFGTDAPVPILPKLTCNPNSGLVHYQRVNGNCFAAPAIGTQGGQGFPYMSAGAYFNNDLATYRSFRIHENQQIQFRASAFNWINHPIPGFSGTTPLTLTYTADYNSKVITPTYNVQKFGIQDSKTAAPYQRIIELNVKYFF